MNPTRREVLRLGAASLVLPLLRETSKPLEKPLRLGLLADLHHGLEPTAMARLEAFVEDCANRSLDAVLQLGDFEYGKPESNECLDLWNTIETKRYHVLGNHDMDFRTKAAMVDRWSMPGPYYSFDLGDVHFCILDRNNLRVDGESIPYQKANFYVESEKRSFADPEQLEWLEGDLESTDRATIVFAHQGLGMGGIKRPATEAERAIEEILESVHDSDGKPKVRACFCGHHHVDRYRQKNGVHYLWVNSASYYWVGSEYGRMATYRDPLFAYVTLHPEGVLEVEGRRTVWDQPTPSERGYPGAEELTPYITDRKIVL